MELEITRIKLSVHMQIYDETRNQENITSHSIHNREYEEPQTN